MKTQTKGELRAEVERLGSLYNEATTELLRLRRKLEALEKLVGVPPEQFRPRTTIELVRLPRSPRTA